MISSRYKTGTFMLKSKRMPPSRYAFKALPTLAIFGTVFSIASTSEDDSLLLLHVVFRHGERTTDEGRYPTDPYINETYYPYGSGQLTNEGKRTEYNLGRALRQRYDSFLGPIYTPDVLDARSSDYNRTKMSLQLVLASLYPPTLSQIWNSGVYWQPIPYNYVPINSDSIFFPIVCPNLATYLAEYLETPEYAARVEPYQELFSYSAENSGLDFTTFFSVVDLYFTLATESEWGFTLPAWTESVYPEPLKSAAEDYYVHLTANTNLKRIVTGGFLKKIVDDTVTKINGGLENTKIFLYSGHELNVGTLLRALDIFDPQIPAYGSYITFEVHNISDTYAIRVLFQNYTQTEPYVMKLPACDVYCPVDQFVTLVEEYFPDETTCG